MVAQDGEGSAGEETPIVKKLPVQPWEREPMENFLEEVTIGLGFEGCIKIIRANYLKVGDCFTGL